MSFCLPFPPSLGNLSNTETPRKQKNTHPPPAVGAAAAINFAPTVPETQ